MTSSHPLSRRSAIPIIMAVLAVALVPAIALAKADKKLVRPKSLETAVLTTGTGDGQVRVTVTPYGTFGSATYGGDAYYNPVGSGTEAGTVYESAVYFSLFGFLHAGDIDGPALDTTATFSSVNSTRAVSTFTAAGFSIQLTQSVSGRAAGSQLTQTYVLRNNTGASQSFYLIRHVDGDLHFDGSISDLAKVVRSGDLMYEFDSGDNPDQPVTFFAIDTSGGAKAGYRVARYRFTDDIISEGSGVLTSVVDDDANGDGMTDEAADWTMTMGRRFTVAAGASVTFTTSTIWGEGAPNSDPLNNVEPIIKANGALDTVTVNAQSPVEITVELSPGNYTNVPVDWWLVAFTGSSWYYMNNLFHWTPFSGNLSDCGPVYQGGLCNLSSFTVWNSGLPVGSYQFWFAVDYPMDGILNINEPILVDAVNVTVQ